MANDWPHVILHETTGLGHQRILSDPGTVNFTIKYIIDHIESLEKSRPGFDEQLEDILYFEKISAVS